MHRHGVANTHTCQETHQDWCRHVIDPCCIPCTFVYKIAASETALTVAPCVAVVRLVKRPMEHSRPDPITPPGLDRELMKRRMLTWPWCRRSRCIRTHETAAGTSSGSMLVLARFWPHPVPAVETTEHSSKAPAHKQPIHTTHVTLISHKYVMHIGG